MVEQATDAGWTLSAQVVAAYLTLAWVALDRDDHPDADGWFARIAEVEAVMTEPHVQLTADALTALRRADTGDAMGALSGLRLTTARLAGNAPPALTDRLAHVEAELLCRVGDIAQASQVLAGLRGKPTGASARSLARLSLFAGNPATAQQALAPFPSDGATVRGQVEGAILRSIITAPHDRSTALSQLDGALLAAAPLGGCVAPSWSTPMACGNCSTPGSKPEPRPPRSPST